MGMRIYRVQADRLVQNAYANDVWRRIGSLGLLDMFADREGHVVAASQTGPTMVVNTERLKSDWTRDPGGSRKALVVLLLEAWTDMTKVPKWSVLPADGDFGNLTLSNLVISFNDLGGFAPSGSTKYRKRGLTVKMTDGRTRYFPNVSAASFATYTSERTLERIKRGEHIVGIPGYIDQIAIGTDRRECSYWGWKAGSETPAGGVILNILGDSEPGSRTVDAIVGYPDGTVSTEQLEKKGGLN